MLALQPENGKDRGWKSTKSVTKEMKKSPTTNHCYFRISPKWSTKNSFLLSQNNFWSPLMSFFCFLVKCSPQKISVFFCFVQISQPQKKKSQPKKNPTNINQPTQRTNGEENHRFPNQRQRRFDCTLQSIHWSRNLAARSARWFKQFRDSWPNFIPKRWRSLSSTIFFKGSLHQPNLT